MSHILIVDDHPVIRMAVKMLLEVEGHRIVGDADNSVDAISLGRELKPDLVILDIGIPKLDGLEVTSHLMVLALPLKILVLADRSAPLFTLRSMQAGAAGFVYKQGGLAELVTVVNAVASGYSYSSSSAMRPVQQSAYSDDVELFGRPSDREASVLQYLSQGYSNKQISRQMFISSKTISTYKTRLLLKLNAGSLMDLIEFAKRNMLIQGPEPNEVPET